MATPTNEGGGGGGGGLPPPLPRPASGSNLRRVTSNSSLRLQQQQQQQQQQLQLQQQQQELYPHAKSEPPNTLTVSPHMQQQLQQQQQQQQQQEQQFIPMSSPNSHASRSQHQQDDDDQDSLPGGGGGMYQQGQMNTLPQAFEKKLRRLEKNRESARECRRRKKEHVVELQKQVALLEAENLKLKLQLKVGEESQAQERQEKGRITKKLDDMVKTGASESDIWQTIDMLKERYSDYGSDRRSAIEFHTNQLEKLLLPTKLTKLCMWMLFNMGDESGQAVTPVPAPTLISSSSAPGKPENTFSPSSATATAAAGAHAAARHLWSILSEELQVTPEQQASLLQHRGSIVAMDADLDVTAGMLHDLRALIDDKNSSLDQELQEVQKILTPTQTAKFILWITRNPACMHMLNQLWRAVYERSEGGGGGGEQGGHGGEGGGGGVGEGFSGHHQQRTIAPQAAAPAAAHGVGEGGIASSMSSSSARNGGGRASSPARLQGSSN